MNAIPDIVHTAISKQGIECGLSVKSLPFKFCQLTHFFNFSSSFLSSVSGTPLGWELSPGQKRKPQQPPKVAQRPASVGGKRQKMSSRQINISWRNIATISATEYYEYLPLLKLHNAQQLVGKTKMSEAIITNFLGEKSLACFLKWRNAVNSLRICWSAKTEMSSRAQLLSQLMF